MPDDAGGRQARSLTYVVAQTALFRQYPTNHPQRKPRLSRENACNRAGTPLPLRTYGTPGPHALPASGGRYGDPPVLVVSRKLGERILIGDKIAITVVKVAGGAVRIGVEAPAELAIMREELAIEIREAEEAAIESSER